MAFLNEVPSLIRRAIRTGTNMHLVGEPGIGKTSVIEQTVADLVKATPDFWYGNVYTPSLSPVDFTAMMPDPATSTLKSFHNDRLPNAFLTPDLVGLLFLGERDNADPATNKALQKYINNEDMGGLRKPRGVIVVSDSNDIGHRSGAVQQSLALLSRSCLVFIQQDADVTLKHFSKIDLYPYVQAYLALRRENISTFDSVIKNREYRVWANPRAWERVSDMQRDADAHQETLLADEIIGSVGEAVGREYLAFLYAAKELVSYDDIVNKPTKAAKPDKLSDVYAITAMLAHSAIPEHMGAIRTYISRYGSEVQVLFLRLLVSSKSKNMMGCTRTKAFTEWFAQPELRDAVLG